jgi:hypothetical protein
LVSGVHAEDLVPFGASWTYLAPISIDEDPNTIDPNFDTAWFMPDYDTNQPIQWEGPDPEPFGYGAINAFANGFATELLTPESGDRWTAYFRHNFTTTSPQSNFAIELLSDDGSKVYLDGVEILSLNCCAFAQDGEPAEFSEYSSAGGNEDRFVIREVLAGQTLDPGDHVLAVDVHQSDGTSSDLGFSLRFISDYEPPVPPENAITTGIDTLLAESGQMGPDTPHGDLDSWEWDGEDGGGQNHGLLWFDIPQEKLDSFGNGTAKLQLEVNNNGNSADVHRVVLDWLSGPEGGDNTTWNDFPDGPGLFPGDNVLEDPSFQTGNVTTGTVMEFDVTEDVRAWASGEPNYGWGFIPTGTDGAGINSFESGFGPILILEPEGGGMPGDFDQDGDLDVADIDDLTQQSAGGTNPAAYDLDSDALVNSADVAVWIKDLFNSWVGDANLDGEFSSADLVVVLASGTYEADVASTWSTGDFNGDGRTNTADLVAALADGGYEAGPRAAAAAVPEPTTVQLLVLGALMLWRRRR